jgi:hypothetical protein
MAEFVEIAEALDMKADELLRQRPKIKGTKP